LGLGIWYLVLGISKQEVLNVLFHIAAGLSTAVLISDTSQLTKDAEYQQIVPVALSGFVIGVISHGALDYIPHCYPINSKLDISLGLLSILVLLWLSKGRYKWIFLGSLLGCIFPDLVDLAPAMLDQAFNLGLPEFKKLFPWHWKQYSGSIYSGECEVSFINHCLVLLTSSIVWWARRKDLSTLFSS